MESEIRQAVALLRDNTLVWSSDMEAIRLELADLMEAVGRLPTHQLDDQMDELVFKVLGQDLQSVTSNDPLEAWIEASTRELGIIAVASRSESFKDALKKMFSAL